MLNKRTVYIFSCCTIILALLISPYFIKEKPIVDETVPDSNMVSFNKMIEEFHSSKKVENMERLREIIGDWEVEKFLFTERMWDADTIAKDDLLIGKKLFIDSDLNVMFDNEKFKPSSFDIYQTNDLFSRYMIYIKYAQNLGDDVMHIQFQPLSPAGRHRGFQALLCEDGRFILSFAEQYETPGFFQLKKI